MNDKFTEYILANDFQSIAETIEFLHSEKDEQAFSFYNIGNRSSALGNDELSILLYEKAIEYKSDDPSFYNNLATSHKRLQNYNESEIFYKKALKVDPNYIKAHLRLALMFAFLNKKEAAIDEYFQYIKKGGDQPDAINICKNTTQGGESLLEILKEYKSHKTSQVNQSEVSTNLGTSMREWIKPGLVAMGMILVVLFFTNFNFSNNYNSLTGKCNKGYVIENSNYKNKCVDEEKVLTKISEECANVSSCIRRKISSILNNSNSNPSYSFENNWAKTFPSSSPRFSQLPTSTINPLSCNKNTCEYKNQCIAKPENAYCVKNDPQNAWLCKYGYRDTGTNCIYQGFNILEKNNNYFGGYGELQIDNSASTDSVIKVIHSSSNNKIIDLYLSKNQKHTIYGIRNGNYEVYSCNASQNILTKELEVSACSKFEDSFNFNTINTATGVQYSIFSITLYQMVGGNAETETVPSYIFDSL